MRGGILKVGKGTWGEIQQRNWYGSDAVESYRDFGGDSLCVAVGVASSQPSIKDWGKLLNIKEKKRVSRAIYAGGNCQRRMNHRQIKEIKEPRKVSESLEDR